MKKKWLGKFDLFNKKEKPLWGDNPPLYLVNSEGTSKQISEMDGAFLKMLDALKHSQNVFEDIGYKFTGVWQINRLAIADAEAHGIDSPKYPIDIPVKETVEAEYDSFWREILEKDGVLDMEQLKRELYDFSKLMRTVSVVYCEVTGGRMSKTSYGADTVIGVYHDHLEDQLNEFAEENKPPVIDGLEDALNSPLLNNNFLGNSVVTDKIAKDAFVVIDAARAYLKLQKGE